MTATDSGMHTFRLFTRTLLALLALSMATVVNAEDDLEAKVKAAYLFHLTKFVEWPALATNEFRICVTGSESVGNMMGNLSNRQVFNRPLKIEVDKLSDPLIDPAQCQVLFIGRGERRSAELLRRVRGSSALTVSDMDGFARSGGIVGFYAEAGKIKLEVNPEAARAADLKISAKLMEIARSVP